VLQTFWGVNRVGLTEERDWELGNVTAEHDDFDVDIEKSHPGLLMSME
jgi:hypothetical protein